MKKKYTDELYHYGVLGMKWGTRRAQNKLNRVDRRSKKGNWSSDATEVAKIKTKKVSQMSNTELNKVNNRKNLERNYKQLNPGAITKGLAIAATVAGALGTISALHSNGGKVMKLGKEYANKYRKGAASVVTSAAISVLSRRK